MFELVVTCLAALENVVLSCSVIVANGFVFVVVAALPVVLNNFAYLQGYVRHVSPVAIEFISLGAAVKD